MIAVIFIIRMAFLLNREDLESSGWVSCVFITLIYNGKSKKSKTSVSISFIISVGLYTGNFKE